MADVRLLSVEIEIDPDANDLKKFYNKQSIKNLWIFYIINILYSFIILTVFTYNSYFYIYIEKQNVDIISNNVFNYINNHTKQIENLCYTSYGDLSCIENYMIYIKPDNIKFIESYEKIVFIFQTIIIYGLYIIFNILFYKFIKFNYYIIYNIYTI